jgi:hypothetical protein
VREILERVASGHLSVDEAVQALQSEKLLVEQLRRFSQDVRLDVELYAFEEVQRCGEEDPLGELPWCRPTPFFGASLYLY